MDHIKPEDTHMGECQSETSPGIFPGPRPVFHQMGNEAISNLERVLAMNSITVQQTCPQGQPPQQEFKPMDLTNGQYNAYLYNAMMQNLAQQQEYCVPTAQTSLQQPSSPLPSNQTAQQQNLPFPPYIQYPFLPFWTACPLPFSPMAYPQIIIPPAMATPQPVGPQLLRPVTQVQQMPMPNYGVKHDYQPIRPKAVETKEEKLNRYKEKRSKRLWSRAPDPKLSQIAQERPRDQNGKFVSTKSSTERDKELKDLKAELSQVKEMLHCTEQELSILKRNFQNDDMYLRQVAQPHHLMNQQAMQELCAQQGVIYSPFRGGNTAVEAFKEKIDFKEQRTALKKIDSPYLTEIEKQRYMKSQTPTAFLQSEMDKQTDAWVEELINTASSSDDEDMNLG